MTAETFLGQTLSVDLSSGKITTEPADVPMYQKYVGGFAVMARMAYDLIPPGVDPLSPENPIVIGAGALAGTLAPGSSKIMAITRYPINGTIGMASGGSGGDALRFAGYAVVKITGKASQPVVLSILDDDVRLVPANDLWGRDIAETTDTLRARFGDDSSVIAIGPTGERLSTISMAFVNKAGNFGKGGLGAVMGSKNLKAILIRGRKGVAVADRKRFMSTVDPICDALQKLSYRDDWLGIGVGIPLWGRRSGWAKTPVDPGDPYSWKELDKSWQAPLTCPTCPVSCKAWVRTAEGRLAPITVMLPVRLWREFSGGNVAAAYQLSDLCNRQGIDHIEVASLISVLVEMYQEGELTLEDTDGLELKKDYATVLQLLERMIKREGLGDLIADGIPGLVRAFGERVKDRAILIKGVRPLEDPRKHFHAWQMDEIVNPRHPVGQPGNTPAFQSGKSPQVLAQYLERLHVPKEAIDRVCTSDNIDMGRLARYAEDFYAACSSVGLCIRVPLVSTYTLEDLSSLYAATTGIEVQPGQLMKAGETAWNIIKMANVREGFSRKDDRIPDAFLEPLVVGDKTFTLKDYYGRPLDRNAVERLIDNYYDERGWSVEDSLPTAAKLTELGLEDLIPDVERARAR